MGSRITKSFMAVLAAGLAATSLTACSSDSSSATTSTETNGPATAGQKEAAEYLAKYSANPTSVGDLKTLPERPPTGKSIINLQASTAIAQRAAAAQKAAARLLGWSFDSIATGPTPASAAAAFDAAIARHPDAILFAGFPAAVFAKQIAEAKAAGIDVVSTATGDGKTDGVLGSVLGAPQMKLYGKLLAAYFVTESGGKGKAGVFSIQAFPILAPFVTAFQSWVKEWCPGCETSVVNQQVTDQGTKTPANVVGFLQRNPDVKWLMFGTGDLAQGVPAALATAGLKDIHIAGTSPGPADLVNVKAGTESAWVGNMVDIANWRLLDVLARNYVKTDTEAAAAALLPLQVITSANVEEVADDASGYYIGVAGYQDQFKKLWRVS
ncbi:substrate-binding domain-containing protein [Streptomyces sp. VNUA24]|uniref:sugar ABC transporter substrate-binding protein n=1 Tax=Streptomyces sp. VNUA24 TaxID=3031131 RepID=UPI0023B79FA9|nr:substrate-binding domain-containing protein [Streptomyces sp. VNUA24]WEH12974.1 substrate-binding domain-containing protein [Streptomyces sp. VNUA24]